MKGYGGAEDGTQPVQRIGSTNVQHADQSNSRRDFLRTTGGGLCLWALGLYLAGCDSSEPLNEEENPGNGTGIDVGADKITLDLSKPAASLLLAPGGHLIILAAKTIAINVDGSTIRAFTSICTHQGCDVSKFEDSRIVCTCHGSEFSTSGQAVKGPATAPLREYAVTREGNIVTISRA
jgi:Rieske Fe-S protein